MDERDMFLEEILAEFGSEEKQSKPEPQKKRTMEESFASEKKNPDALSDTVVFKPVRTRNAPERQPKKAEKPVKEEKKTAPKKAEKKVQPPKQEKVEAPGKKSFGMRLLGFLGKFSLILLETVLLLLITAYGVLFILAKGPSPTARDLFVRSVRETSAIGFIAEIYFTEDEIAQIENAEEIEEYQETDTSLITIAKPEDTEGADGPVPDAWGLVDEDGDGIILESVTGEGYVGYMLVIPDPSQVILGSVPTSYGARGFSVEEMVKNFDGLAGINAGGFYDPDGTGNGSIPDTLVVYEGKTYYAGYGVGNGFVGLDSNHILHVGKLTKEEIEARDIQYGVCFGPVLISNGEVVLAENNVGGLNPRTAIGQRSDGAILMLVIDGRQVTSIGATYRDLVDIFLEYGAVNACNLDGGSSSMMWYGDSYVNNCASVIGIRPVPTAFVVLKKGVEDNA